MIRILLAESDETLRRYLARSLRHAGCAVVAVDRGTAALPRLRDGRFDLLLTDVVMPEMDGIELAQRCAELSPRTEVIFISGFAAVRLHRGRAAAERIPARPFHLRHLVGEVRSLFRDPALSGSRGG